jgi:hypothetical protein
MPRLLMSLPALVALTFGCVTADGDPTPSAVGPQATGRPVVEPGALVNETTPPDAPVVEQERCRPSEDAAAGWPGRPQVEAGVLSTVPDTFGVPRDTRAYARTGCAPAH